MSVLSGKIDGKQLRKCPPGEGTFFNVNEMAGLVGGARSGQVDLSCKVLYHYTIVSMLL